MQIRKIRVLAGTAVAFAFLWQLGTAAATTSYLDLTNNKTESLGDAIFGWGGPASKGIQETVNSMSQGTGSYIQSGMNTNYGTKFKNNDYMGGSMSNHGFQKDDMCVVTIGGKDYYQFTLNLSQDTSSPGESMDDFKIYYSSSGSLNNYTSSGLQGGTLAFNMDTQKNGGKSVGDVSVLMDSDTKHSSTYTVSVLASDFKGAKDSDYIYLYSTMGSTGDNCKGSKNSSCTDYSTHKKVGDLSYKSNGGSEEWSVDKCKPGCGGNTVPEPETLALMGLGIIGLVISKRRTAA